MTASDSELLGYSAADTERWKQSVLAKADVLVSRSVSRILDA
jgi:hypothetical protein